MSQPENNNGSGLESNPQDSQDQTNEPVQPLTTTLSQASTVIDEVPAVPEEVPAAAENSTCAAPEESAPAGAQEEHVTDTVDPPTSPILKKRPHPHTLEDPRILNSPMAPRIKRRRVEEEEPSEVLQPSDISEPQSPLVAPTSP